LERATVHLGGAQLDQVQKLFSSPHWGKYFSSPSIAWIAPDAGFM